MREFVMPTKKEIDSLKRQHKSIHQLTLSASGKTEAVAIVRYPRLADIQQSVALGDGSEFSSGWIQFENCVIAADPAIYEDDELKYAAAIKMGTIFEVYESTIISVPVTAELIDKIKGDLEVEVLTKVRKLKELRKLVVLNGKRPADGEKDKREIIEAYLMPPTLAVRQLAVQSGDAMNMGIVYMQECWLSGDSRLRSGDNDEIRFAAIMASVGLFKRYTATVEKL